MNNKMRLLGIVITYYPNVEETKRNIMTYIEYVDKLIIWENTPLDDRSEFKISMPEYENKILYMGEQENMFIEYPLNCAIKFGQENGFTLLLTMDQDRLTVFTKYPTVQNSPAHNFGLTSGLIQNTSRAVILLIIVTF